MIKEIKEMRMSIKRSMEEDEYDVDLDNETITVTVTHSLHKVKRWILKVLDLYEKEAKRFVVGVRYQWTNSEDMTVEQMQQGRVDVVQFCAGQNCLVFQIRRAFADRNIPPELLTFLGDDRFTFAGVEIDRCCEILKRDYGIHFGKRIADLNKLYAFSQEKGSGSHKLRMLINIVLEKDYKIPPEILSSHWNAELLEEDQILYASANAYCCFKIATILCMDLPYIFFP